MFTMLDQWDCYEPSEDEWAASEQGAFEFRGNIKSQSSILTKALAELLCHLKKLVGTTQQLKSKLAMSIASVLLIHPDWVQVSPATVRLAQVGRDKADLLAALFAVDFRLDANAPVQHLMFCPVPLDLAPQAPLVQREPVVDTTQPAAALADPMAAVLALLQEQKAALERLEASQIKQKAASE